MAAFHRDRFEMKDTKHLPSDTHRLAIHNPLTAAAQRNAGLSRHGFSIACLIGRIEKVLFWYSTSARHL